MGSLENLNGSLILREQKGFGLTFQEMDKNFEYLNSLIKPGANKGIQGLQGPDGRSGITFSHDLPINPDLNPENTVWFQINSRNSIISIFTWKNGNWNLSSNKWQRNVITSCLTSGGLSFSGDQIAGWLDAGYNNENSILNIIEHNEYIGMNTTFSMLETNYCPLPFPLIDVLLHYYTLPSDRANSIINLYDKDHIFIGSILITKDSNTWSRDDYSTILIRDMNNNVLLDIGADKFSGTSYGNGAVYGTFVFTDPSKIEILYPRFTDPSTLNTHIQKIDQSYLVNHNLENVAYITHEITTYYNTYSAQNNPNVFTAIGSGFSLFQRVEGY